MWNTYLIVKGMHPFPSPKHGGNGFSLAYHARLMKELSIATVRSIAIVCRPVVHVSDHEQSDGSSHVMSILRKLL